MKTNENKKNDINEESPKTFIDNAQVNESDKDLEKKALIDLLEERIRASKIDSNIDNDKEDDEEPETDDDMEYSTDDDHLDDIHAYKEFPVDMDADDYHNQSCTLARLSHVEEAVECVLAGLRKFPFNATLLADAIKYMTETGNIDRAAKYYSMLKKVDLCLWDWRAFSYSFDFLLASNARKNEKEIRQLLKDYKIHLPYEEKQFLNLAELEQSLGNSDKSLRALEKATKELSNACQCALRLADIQFEHGLYEQTIRTCNYGISAAASPQEKINTSYLMFLRTLSKDHILQGKVFTEEEVSEAEVRSVEEDYKRLLSQFEQELHHYKDIMRTRLKLLAFIKTMF